MLGPIAAFDSFFLHMMHSGVGQLAFLLHEAFTVYSSGSSLTVLRAEMDPDCCAFGKPGRVLHYYDNWQTRAVDSDVTEFPIWGFRHLFFCSDAFKNVINVNVTLFFM